MSIALFAVPTVLAPLQGLWRRFLPAATQGGTTNSILPQGSPESAARSVIQKVVHGGAAAHCSSMPSIRRPLRVVRILEVNQTPAQVGRMVISGCMADVCAELDRLAAREAALH